MIDETKPTTVYTHTTRDVHQDHRSVHSATLVSRPPRVARLCVYQARRQRAEFHPTRFVAIDEYLERKIEVIHAFASR